MTIQIKRANHKVRVIDSVTNSTIKVTYLKPVSIRGFDNYHYDGRLYAAFVNKETQENVIYVDTTRNEIEELAE